jgi:hypothetical protein
MRKFLAVAAVFAIIISFGLIHSSSVIAERISIGLMGFGTSYLIYLLVVTRPKRGKRQK